ncbi:MAG: hypothetical protein WCH46_09340 [bacterium]
MRLFHRILPPAFLAIVLFSLALSSCSNGNNIGDVILPNNDTTNNSSWIPPSANTMKVAIDGKYSTFTAFAFRLVIFGDSSIIVTGTSLNSTGVGLGTLGINTKGNYNIGTADTNSLGGPATVVMTYSYVAPGNDTVKYASPNTVSSNPVGSVTITELTETTFKAAFHATLTKKQGIAGNQTVAITNGGVNATFY